MRTLHDATQRDTLYRTCLRKRHIERMLTTGDRTVIIDLAEIVGAEERAVAPMPLQPHHGSAVVEPNPQGVSVVHLNGVSAEETDEASRWLSGAFSNSQ